METALRPSHCITSIVVSMTITFLLSNTAISQIQEEIIRASDGKARDWFGFSVAISGDYAVVGAPNQDNGGINRGAAYVFAHTPSGWIQQAKLTASDLPNSGWFGHSVAIDGDYLIVGAPRSDRNGIDRGTAYVYRRSGSNWLQEAELQASDGAREDWFGYSVAISANYCLIGMPGDDDFAYESGSAYVFVRSENTWTEQAKLHAARPISYSKFGKSVALQGSKAVIGAPVEYNSGAAYVFSRTGTLWVQNTRITNNVHNSSFGIAVALHNEHLAVGAYNTPSGGTVYIFKQNGAVWTQIAESTPDDAYGPDCFGHSVSITEGLFMAGSAGNDQGYLNSGAAYISKLSPVRFLKFTSSTEVSDDQYGSSVALTPSVGIIGKPHDDFGGNNRGSAVIVSSLDKLSNCILTPDSGAYGRIENGDQTHADQVEFVFNGSTSDVLVSIQAYDVNDPTEVEVFLNGVGVAHLPITPELQWGDTYKLLLPHTLVSPYIPNIVAFKNRDNPPGSDYWGVRKFDPVHCFSLPSNDAFGYIDKGDQQHLDDIKYWFGGRSGDQFLSFESYDIDVHEPVKLLVNGTAIYSLPPTGNGLWSTPVTLTIADSLVNDSQYNVLVFDNLRTPSNVWQWGIRNVNVDSCLWLPSAEAYGKINNGDQSHLKEVCYSFWGTPGDFNLLYQVYDIDTQNEVDILLNGMKLHDVAIGPDLDWSDTRALFIRDDQVNDAAVNRLTFRNVTNFSTGKQWYWGVRQVSLSQTIPLPYAEEAGSRTSHMNEASFVFEGHTGDLLLNFEAFDIDNINEVDVILSGIKFHNVAITGDNQWSGPRTILLPDSLIQDYNQNVITFDNTRNPPKTWAWGVRNLSIAPALTAAEVVAPSATLFVVAPSGVGRAQTEEGSDPR